MEAVARLKPKQRDDDREAGVLATREREGARPTSHEGTHCRGRRGQGPHLPGGEGATASVRMMLSGLPEKCMTSRNPWSRKPAKLLCLPKEILPVFKNN